jgi:hypothetical protein
MKAAALLPSSSGFVMNDMHVMVVMETEKYALNKKELTLLKYFKFANYFSIHFIIRHE